MPVTSSTPTVNVSIPIPTPVQSNKPKTPRGPRQPVSFGGEDDVQQSPMIPQIPRRRRNLSAVILPWLPSGPSKLSRKLPKHRYSGLVTEEDFHKMLDTNPNDHDTRLVFADWLQDRDDPRAEGYRVLGTLRVRPQIHSYVAQWGRTSNKHAHNKSALLHPKWWELTKKFHPSTKGLGSSTERWWTSHDTRRDAEDAAALAFAKLSPRMKASILNQSKKG